MIRVALKGLAGRKLRAALTALAIVLGVAMVSGTYVFTDTIDKAVDALFTGAYTGADAVVSGKAVVESSASGDATVPAALLGQVAALPEVEAASGGIVDRAQARRRQRQADLDARLGHRPQRRCTPERAPVQPAEAHRGPLAVRADGDRDRRRHRRQARPGRRRHDRRRDARPGPALHDHRHRRVQRARLDRRADARDLRRPDRAGALREGGPVRRDLRGREGRRLAGGSSCARSSRSCPRRAEVATGAGQGRRRRPKGTTRTSRSSRSSCSRSAAIALFVGAFVIFNTLSITVAQRTRELATLRTLGASRRQVLGSVVLESLVIGVVGSVDRAARSASGSPRAWPRSSSPSGSELPESGAVLATRTVVVSPARRRPDHARRRALPGAPRDARAADRGRARGRDAAAVARSRRYAPLDRRARRSRSASAVLASRHVRRRPRRVTAVLAAARARLLRPLRRRRD